MFVSGSPFPAAHEDAIIQTCPIYLLGPLIEY